MLSLNPGLRGLDEADTRAFYRRVYDTMQAVPGVEAAALAQFVPLDFSIDGGDFVVEGRMVEPGREGIQAMSSAVDDHYFPTLNTAIRRGRAFTARDTIDAPTVAIVNETFAAMAWPGQDPVGRRIRLARADAPWLEVVGVSADGKYRQLTESPQPFVWTALAQQNAPNATLVVKSARDSAAMVNELRQAVARWTRPCRSTTPRRWTRSWSARTWVHDSRRSSSALRRSARCSSRPSDSTACWPTG